MSIKTRLLLSYIAMLIVPIILSIIASYVVAVYFIGDIAGDEGRGNFMRRAEEQRDRVLNEVKVMSIKNPDALADKAFLEGIQKKLQPLHSSIVVRKQDRIIYGQNDQEDLSKQLPSFGSFSQNYKLKNEERVSALILHQHDFYFNDNMMGTISMAI